ncbi:hypothetical protein P8452_51546 [Trifolium repens]|nr:hypothetical protein P8452_51546 [Trifolium repens]
MAISSSQFHVAPVSSPIVMRSHFSFKWEIVVNTSIARARNVLTFPREYSRNCLSSSDNIIYMIDVATGSIFKSPIFTSTKNREDRYVYSAWKSFVKEKKLRFKDRVIFNAKNGNHIIEVQIIRRRNTH